MGTPVDEYDPRPKSKVVEVYSMTGNSNGS
jgi:hypothetical protein